MVALLVAAPAMAQLPFVPDYALPRAGDSPSTYVAGGYARGVNDDSGKNNAFGAVVGRSTGRFSYQGGVGYVLNDLNDLLLGAAVGFHFLESDSPMQIGLQAGFGWVDFGTGSKTLRFPIGVALSRSSEGPTRFSPWVMPRLNIQRVEQFGTFVDTDLDFGASAGVSVTSEGGFGLNAALDVVFAEGAIDNITPFTFSIGTHYILGN